MGHFLLSSILGCHPPLVGHSIFLRTEAVKQCGRIRTLRKAQLWLERIGLQFLPVDQVGFANLQAENRIEYWSENHVSEDFELMIHLYSLGFNGRYCHYEGTEFEEGITRYFDEEAGRHRKFALGAHELVFNPIQDMISHGVFTPVFKTFWTCNIPSYYKVFLTAYLCSYTSGGVYIIIFTASAITRLLDSDGNITSLSVFNPTGVVIFNFAVFFVLGYVTFIITLLRMRAANPKLLFPEYRKKWFGGCYLMFTQLRYGFVFQWLFYNVAAFTFYFLGSMDHLLGRNTICAATNKDGIEVSRCRALWDTIHFNSGSWLLAFLLLTLSYATIVQEYDWDPTEYPDTKKEIILHALFAGPAAFLGLMALVVPIILNPWILGWPFLRAKKPTPVRKVVPRTRTVDIPTMMKMSVANNLDVEIMQSKDEPDIEIGSLATSDLRTVGTASPQHAVRSPANRITPDRNEKIQDTTRRLPSIQEFDSVTAIRERSVERRYRSGNNNNTHSRDSSLDRSYTKSRESSQRGARTINAPRASYEDRPPSRNSAALERSPSWEDRRSSHSRHRRASSPGRVNQTGISPGRPRLHSPGSPGQEAPLVRNYMARSAYATDSASRPRTPSRRDEWGFPVVHSSV
jgi:hypothetical protein